MLAQIKKIGLILPVLFLCAIPASAQLGTIQGFCDNGGNHALTSGQPSSNYLQGDIPLCTVSVFYHDSTTLAPIFMGENSTGTLNSVQVTAGGSYSVCPTGVSFSGGGGSGATATVSCTAGAVVSVAVTSPGSGYTTAPTVSFTGGTGSGATAVATIVGDLTNPFQANTDGSWRVWAAIATGYDVTMSGGIPPNNYAQPRTIANIFPNAFGGTSYTIIQANGTASAPTSPVNFINSGTVDFSITGNQVSAAVNVGSTLALKHNSSLSGILQTLYNLCDNGSCGPALDAGMQPVLAKTGSNDGSWVLETASTATQVQQLPTGLPATGQYVIIYPQAGSTSCSGGGQCSFAVGTGAWMQMSNTGTIFGAGSSVNLTGTALPAGVLDANVTAAYNCSTGYASGYGAKSIPNAALTSASISYATYCTKVASGPGYNYAGASWQSAMSCSSGCSGQSMFSYAQPFMVVYYSGTPVTNNYLSFASPLIVQGQTVGLATGWPTVIDTGTANAYVSGAPWVTALNPGQEVIMVAQTTNTGASTFVFNGAPAANIVKAGGAALASGDITTTAPALLIYQTGGTWLDLDPQTGGGSGSVTSVGMTVPSWLTVAGSPVTSSGTLAVTAAGAQAQNEVLASPNGSAGAVALRALVNGDLPTSGVTAGSYTNSNLTINAQGIVTAASNGSGGGVSSVSNSDGSLTISPTTGAVVGSLNYAHAGTWTALETFSAGVNLSGASSPLEVGGSAGSSNQCLLSAGTGATPTWGTCPGSGGTAQPLTMNNSGSGAASGTTFNGTAAETISYNTIGAAPALSNCSDESSTFTPVSGNCYFVTASVSTATPAASAFVLFSATTSSAGSLALTGTTIADGGNCSTYISGSTLTLPASQSVTVLSDGSNLRARCTAAAAAGVSTVYCDFNIVNPGIVYTCAHNLGVQYPGWSCTSISGAMCDPSWITWADANDVQVLSPVTTHIRLNLYSTGSAATVSEVPTAPVFATQCNSTSSMVCTASVSSAGQLSIAVVSNEHSGVTLSLSSSPTNTWTSTPQYNYVQAFYSLNAASGSTTYTGSSAGGNSSPGIVEVNFIPGTPLSFDTGTGSGTGVATSYTSPTFTTTGHDLVVLCVHETGGSLTYSPGLIGGVQSTLLQGPNVTDACEMAIFTSPQTNITAAISGINGAWGGTVLAFKF